MSSVITEVAEEVLSDEVPVLGARSGNDGDASEKADAPEKEDAEKEDAEKAPAKYRLIDLPRTETKAAKQATPAIPEAVFPEAVPEAFAKLLDPKGMRLVGPRGEAIYDLWFRREIPLGEKPVAGMRIYFPNLELGGLVGVLRSYGKEVDYRESELPEGVYSMRYSIQPEDGDHMGTAETRDFLVLCNFEEDKSTDPVPDMIDLGEMSIMSSSTDHPLICYLVVPEGEAPKAKTMYAHPDRHEWIADVQWVTRAKGAEETKNLRVGVVLIGISEHF